MTWVDTHVMGISEVTPEERVTVYHVVDLFFARIKAWESFRPIYDEVYTDPEFRKRYPFFVDPKDGLFMVLLRPDQKLTDLEPYKQLKGKTVEEVFGYAGDKRLMDDVRGEGTRQTLIMPASDLTNAIHGAWNTIYHEFGHLLHLSLLTRDEFEKLESLYVKAMESGAVLDSYAAHNSSEYFGQGLEAFLSETKPETSEVTYFHHTKAELLKKDPELYEFVSKLLN